MTDPFARPTGQAPPDPRATGPAAPAQPAGAASAPDPFGGPAPRGDRPKMRDLYGRLVLVMPKKLDRGVATKWTNDDGTVKRQDRLTMDVVVLDGGPLGYGGDPQGMPPTPHTRTVETPARFDAMYDSHAAIISQTRDALANHLRQQSGVTLSPSEHTMILGRVRLGERSGENKPPFVIEPATDTERETARAWVRANHRDPFGSAA